MMKKILSIFTMLIFLTDVGRATSESPHPPFPYWCVQMKLIKLVKVMKPSELKKKKRLYHSAYFYSPISKNATQIGCYWNVKLESSVPIEEAVTIDATDSEVLIFSGNCQKMEIGKTLDGILTGLFTGQFNAKTDIHTHHGMELIFNQDCRCPIDYTNYSIPRNCLAKTTTIRIDCNLSLTPKKCAENYRGHVYKKHFTIDDLAPFSKKQEKK